MLLRFAFRNARRNVRRTILTALTITLGCILLTIGLSWISGVYNSFVEAMIQNSGTVRITTENYYEKEALNPLEENLASTETIEKELGKIEGITGVYPKISQGVAASRGGEELGEIFGLLTGAPIEYYQKVLKLDQHVYQGTFFTQQAKTEGLIGRTLAMDMDIQIGEDAIFIGQTQDGSISPIKVTVVGLLDSGNSVFDRQAYVHIDKARWMADIPDGSTELLIYGAGDAQKLAVTIKETVNELKQSKSMSVEEELAILAWNEREPFASLIIIPKIVSSLLASIIIFVTALGVLNTMMMSVLERTAEIGILRAMGMQREAIAFTFLLESMIIAMVGGTTGSLIGSLISIWMADKGINLGDAVSNVPDALPINTTLYPDWSIELALFTLGLSLIMALVGAIIPSWQANRITPIQAMRNKH
jgi:putative ABC transport system permease protein